jgi:hypothetical protein
MDYPAPRITLENGEPSLADAYGVGMGRWDNFAVSWLYGTDDETEGDRRMTAALAEGLRFVGDNEARPLGAAHPVGSLWDDGADPVAELRRMMDVRRVVVSRFGPRALYPGEPVSNLRRKFVPIWLVHRYQLEAAAKLIGGVDFSYSRNGDGQEAARVVAADRQRAALEALLDTLSPDALTVPATLLPYLSAGWSGNSDRQETIEIFRASSGNVFDPLVASETAAQQTLNNLLAPDRLNRLEAQHATDGTQMTPAALIDTLLDRVFASGAGQPELRARVATATVLAIARVQRDAALSPTVSLALSERLSRLARTLQSSRDDWSRGLGRLLGDNAALAAALAEPRRTPTIPPGMPIGSGEADLLGF